MSYPAPPNWPLYFIHQSQWDAFHAAGLDMRMFRLDEKLPISAEMDELIGATHERP